MGKTITRKQVVELRKEFDAEPSNKVAQNAVTNVQLPDLTLNRDLVQDIDDSFSIKLDDWKVTAQMRTGRCWLFATLNLFRVGAMKKMKLKNFEFSQATSTSGTSSSVPTTCSRRLSRPPTARSTTAPSTSCSPTR